MSSSDTMSDSARIQLLLRNNRATEAKTLCSALTQTRPDDPDTWLLLAAVHAQLGELTQVVDCCQKAIKLRPNDGTAHYNLGVALQGLRRHQEAEIAFRQAIYLRPGSATAFTNLSAVLHELGRSKEALEPATQAVKLSPTSPQAHNNLGLALKAGGRHEEAAVHFQQALTIKPDMAEARYNLGLVHYANRKIDDAIACFVQAISINPDYADAYSDLGVAQQAQGDLQQALLNYDRAIAIRPDFADARMNRSMAWLLSGDFAKGWPEYEWRLRRKEASSRHFAAPRWDGSTISGKRLLVHAEQGVGDTIQFVRYLPCVKERGAFVIVACQPELHKLLQSCAGIDLMLGSADPLPEFDMHVPLLSLPGIFQTTLETIPASIPYVRPPSDTKVNLDMLLKYKNKRRVGIVWAGNPGHTNDHNRSCLLSHFAVLANFPEVRLFSLQKGERSAELKTASFSHAVTELGDSLANFADTASVVEELDLVVTVDTSVAHLAGAMGRPVWLLLPFKPDWRWLLNREDSPWYPTMRLFRQNRPGNWAEVFERVRTALATLVTPGQRADD